MKKLAIGVMLGALGMFAWQRMTPPAPAADGEDTVEYEDQQSGGAVETVATEPRFKCDGRKYCSQMHSCDEAMYFLEHCPGVKMDGEGDGVPCEKQWCGHQR